MALVSTCRGGRLDRIVALVTFSLSVPALIPMTLARTAPNEGAGNVVGGGAPSVTSHMSGASMRDPVQQWRPEIAEASARFGIPVAWIERVMRAESGGSTTQNSRPITSRAGAMGLMQLMPATWQELRARLSLGSDPYNPRDSILAGAAYLRMMYDRFGYPGLFAAYNAGPARYAAHLATGRPLPSETRRYLDQVAGVPRQFERAVEPSALRLLFALRARWNVPAGSDQAKEVAPCGECIFAIKHSR